MKRATHSILLAILIAAMFLAGAWYGQHRILQQSHAGARRILYYTDPMHPAYKSDKPGIAPDCGMELVAVYEDQGSVALDLTTNVAEIAPGTVSISPEKQQLIGVKLDEVAEQAGAYTLRLFGRVAPDETRVYRLNAGVDGSIRAVSLATTGSQVRKHQLLATFAAPEFVTAIQAYLVALSAMDRLKHNGSAAEIASQIDLATGNPTNTNFQERLQKLENMGISSLQLDEIRRTRRIPESIKVFAPADGFVLARNVSEGQKFDRGTELYRVANLQRVWILVDVAPGDARHLRSGMRASIAVPGQNMSVPARISDILPQFDAGSARWKLRLEAENSGFALRPDMFVDVGVPITLPSMITLPADAVLDSGTEKRVFVARGEGVFEPRAVEVGTRFDDRVQIVHGLAPGEHVAVAGNFLLDSESRLKRGREEAPAPGRHEPHSGATAVTTAAEVPDVTDPACGMPIARHRAVAAGHTTEYRGTTYYFCSASCKHTFDNDAAGVLKRTFAPPASRRSPDAAAIAPRPAVHAGRQG